MFCAMPTTITILKKCGRYVTVCTVRLKVRFATSFRRIARIMDEAVPKTRLIRLIASVFLKPNQKSSSWKSHSKLPRPIHAAPSLMVERSKF